MRTVDEKVLVEIASVLMALGWDWRAFVARLLEPMDAVLSARIGRALGLEPEHFLRRAQGLARAAARRACQVPGCGQEGRSGRNERGAKDGTGVWCPDHSRLVLDERKRVHQRARQLAKAVRGRRAAEKRAERQGAGNV